jgi:hypothetical protein
VALIDAFAKSSIKFWQRWQAAHSRKLVTVEAKLPCPTISLESRASRNSALCRHKVLPA